MTMHFYTLIKLLELQNPFIKVSIVLVRKKCDLVKSLYSIYVFLRREYMPGMVPR